MAISLLLPFNQATLPMIGAETIHPQDSSECLIQKALAVSQNFFMVVRNQGCLIIVRRYRFREYHAQANSLGIIGESLYIHDHPAADRRPRSHFRESYGSSHIDSDTKSLED